MLRLINKTLSALILASYISMTLFSVVHIAHMADMGMPMDDCPFAFGEHSLCHMSVFEHMKAWQTFSTTFIPTIEVIFALIIIFTIFVSLLLPSLIRLLLYERSRRVGIPIFLQLLFAEGILYPKIP